MSTLKATQADGFFIPNDPSAPSKQGKRFPSKIRFEMPFHIWCKGCGAKIAKGVRFNAKKKHIDDYLSTKIYSFGMNCHLCSHRIVINTDPKTTEFIVDSGGDRKTEDYSAKDAEAIQLERHGERMINSDNSFLKLEREQKDKKIGVSAF